MESLGQEESDIKLLQAKVAFLETQVAALRRSSVETESESQKKKEKTRTKAKYKSFDELVTAFDDSKEEDIKAKSPVIEADTINTREFFLSQIQWKRRTGESIQKANHRLITNFFRTPFYQECYMSFATLLCFDVILYMFSNLILRFFILIASVFESIFHVDKSRTNRGRRSLVFDFIRLILVCWGCFIISMLNTSYIYHYIRSISGFKIYLIMNILGTFDSLFTSIEHNVSDALFYSMHCKPSFKSTLRFVQDTFLSLIFVSVLAVTKFLSFMTFNVALNMNPQTYIIYTVSRKFKYLKKTIYKKCDEINLFDHSCRDIEERFTFFVNVILTAWMLYQSNDLSRLYWEQVAALFLIDEIVVILKHMILLKQNRWPPEIYNNYRALLKRDYLLTVQNNYDLDPTHVVSERLGVSVIATSSLILSSLLKFVCKPLYQQLSLPVFILFVIALLFLLCIFKFLSSAWLLSLCRHGINFVNITTVDNEVVATEKQIGDEKKEIPEPIIKES
ncbi:hypothetical protein WA171_000496, partial [Blastocystis sp. BT1]